jgi:hypothetical protein
MASTRKTVEVVADGLRDLAHRLYGKLFEREDPVLRDIVNELATLASRLEDMEFPSSTDVKSKDN